MKTGLIYMIKLLRNETIKIKMDSRLRGNDELKNF